VQETPQLYGMVTGKVSGGAPTGKTPTKGFPQQPKGDRLTHPRYSFFSPCYVDPPPRRVQKSATFNLWKVSSRPHVCQKRTASRRDWCSSSNTDTVRSSHPLSFPLFFKKKLIAPCWNKPTKRLYPSRRRHQNPHIRPFRRPETAGTSHCHQQAYQLRSHRRSHAQRTDRALSEARKGGEQWVTRRPAADMAILRRKIVDKNREQMGCCS